jgi:3-hydroxy-D-aspartate aldolase
MGMSSDKDLHGHLLGVPQGRGQLNTPVLLVDAAILDRNIALMAQRAEAAGVKLRPHGKTHKCVDIAQRQLDAGAVGLCCAKIGEAEVMADGGITGLLITSPITSPPALARMAALAARSPDLMAVVDHPHIAQQMDAHLAAAGASLDVLIDIDPGIARTGVTSPEKAVELAQAIAASPNLRLNGVQFYCGSQQHVEDYAERRAAMVGRAQLLSAHIAALSAAGFAPQIISGSGTGTHQIDGELGLFTEWQAGSYVFMDRQYQDCDLSGDGQPLFETSLFVDASVVSANHGGLVTVDAGFKALSSDGGLPTVVAGGPQQAHFAFMGDEHGALIWPDIAAELPAGSRVTMMVPHCDPTVNLYDHIHVVEHDQLIDIWLIGARGRSR